MLHQLRCKTLTFSELNDIIIKPGGQDEVPTSELEDTLKSVSTYQQPVGLERGKYKLKPELITEYNPYFLHLSKESHQMARDNWLRYRATNKHSVPLVKPRKPLSFVQEIRHLLISRGCVKMIHSCFHICQKRKML